MHVWRARRSGGKGATRQHHRVAADAGAFDAPVVHVDLEGEQARPCHLEALLDDIVMGAAGRLVEMADHAGEARDRRPGGRVLGDAGRRREHAGVEVMAASAVSRQ